MANFSEAALGYLGWHRMGKRGGCTGGLLVITDEGFPREFRCTEPIRAGTVQSILYGDSLELYVLGKLIGENLWSHTELKPPMLLINDRKLWCVQDRIDVPVGLTALVAQDGEIVQLGEADEDVDSFLIDTPSGDRVHVSLRGGAVERATDCRELLDHCARQIDILEPFGRVQAVLEALERQHSDKR